MSREADVSKLILPAQASFHVFSEKLVNDLHIIVLGVIVLCLVSLFLVTIGLHGRGQSYVTTAALMYLPLLIWVVPAYVILVPARYLDSRSGLCLCLTTVLILEFHVDSRFLNSSAQEFIGNFVTFRFLNSNRGLRGQRPIKDALQADLTALQETRVSGNPKDPEYADFMQVHGIREFVLLSRMPILDATLIQASRSKVITAVRYQVAHGLGRFVVCNVRVPRLRDTLRSYKRSVFIWGILELPGSPKECRIAHYQPFWEEQVIMAQDIVDYMAKEKEPVVVVGCFNTPFFGPIYRAFANQFQDDHLKAGEGTGFTFPGNTHNPMALFPPWLRVDMIFAPQHWKLLSCETFETLSQHRSVFAEFEWARLEP